MAPDSVPSIGQQVPWPIRFLQFPQAAPDLRYFNSAIIQHHQAPWLFLRQCVGQGVEPEFGRFNSIGAAPLNHLEELIPIQLPREYPDQQFEDPRIARINHELWLSYCTYRITDRVYSPGHQQVVKLNDQLQPSSPPWSPLYGRNHSLNHQRGQEKSWTWFEFNGQPHLLYHLHPHTVVQWQDQVPIQEHLSPAVPWEHGYVGGGTPPIQQAPHQDFTVFFHAHIPWGKKRRYTMGAYQFEPRPPFRVTRVTPQPILIGSRNDPWLPNYPLVVFPAGAYFEHNTWTISLGVNDVTTAIMEIPDEELQPLFQAIAPPGVS